MIFYPYLQKTPSRKKYLNFTTPYIKSPIALVTKPNVNFISNISDLKDKKLGIVKDYSIKELLQYQYPNINFVKVNSIQDGLKKVHEGRIFGFLDNFITIKYQLQQNDIKDITISGVLKEYFSLSVASRNDEKVLHNILEKAVYSIDKKNYR